MIKIKINVKDGAKVPEYQSINAAGADVYAYINEPVVIKKGKTELIPTGISIEIPVGYEAQVRPRSGLAVKHGLTILNSPGTIDSDYRGEVKIILTNLGDEDFIITNEMRIAQIVFSKVYQGDYIKVETLNKTDRNDGGFGHTGI